MNNDMKKTLVLITTSFPYGKLEPFIESELNYYKNFDKVLCLAIHRNGEPREIKYPENFAYCSVKDYKFKRDVKYIPKLLVKKSFWSEIYTLLRRYRFTIKNIHHLISLGIQSEHYYKAIRKKIEEFEQKDGQDNRYTFYSYWMVEHAMCGIMLKKYYKNAINITRAHGYDLYEYRNKGKYIPYRKYLLENSNLVLPVSLDGVKYLEKQYGKRDNVILSRLGTKDYLAKDYIKTEYDLSIVSCGWCTEVKRINRIIEALSNIKDLKIKWVHFGDGYLLEKLRNTAKETLSTNINYEFKGAVTNKEIIEFYKINHVDLFINVSSSEGIPVSIMEAQSFGIPVIATDVGGVKEIITHNENGVLLNKDFKIEELVTEIRKYSILSEREINMLRTTSRKMWEEKYSARNNYERLFDKIISL